MATVISLTFAACNNNDDDLSTPVPVVSGTLANFGKYVTLEILLAGYSDVKKGKKGHM
jgi:hypothetical protein